MISEWIKMGLLMISAFGYWEYFRSKHQINIYFAPVFTISVQFSVLFAAGLLNCLGEAAVLLYGFGFLLFLLEIKKNRLRTFLPYINAGYLCFFLVFLAVGFAVLDKRFTQIDNFTHWATVVRNMLSTDRFPTFKETAVEFTTYPLGSSALIYFVCKMTAEAECMQMWAQAYCMLCAFLPVFSCCRKNKGAFLALVIVMTGFLLNYNIPITELLVDTLMPLAGMAAALFICCHCAQQEGKTELSPYYAIPLLIWIMNIKHAALIFVVFDLALLYLCIRKKEHGRKQWAMILLTVLLTNVLWNRHCDYVFDNASYSRHSMSLNWFRTILGDKTPEGILSTVKMVLVQVVTRTECLWLLVWLFILGILVWVWLREEKKQYILLLLTSIAMYAVYAIGILGMYVFSMEDYGMLLAFTRYMRTIDIAIYYMLTVFSGMLLTKLTKMQYAAAVSTVLIFLTAAGWRFQTGEYLKEQLARCPEDWRQELEQPITEYGLPTGKRYLLCINENHQGWARRIWRYNLETGAVDQLFVEDESDLQIADNYDYIVIFDEGNPIIDSWIRENYPDSIGSRVIKCSP